MIAPLGISTREVRGANSGSHTTGTEQRLRNLVPVVSGIARIALYDFFGAEGFTLGLIRAAIRQVA